VRIVSVAAGAHHSLAVSDAGQLFAWGRAGRLGHSPPPGGELRDELAPRVVRPTGYLPLKVGVLCCF